MGLKPTDYQKSLGIVTESFTRPVKVKDSTVNITVQLKMNHNRKTFEVISKMTWGAITGSPKTDAMTLKLINELQHVAIEEGVEWLKEMRDEEEDEDPQQIKIPHASGEN